MSFRTEQVFPGVTHITDGMGVCMTLLAGSERALLIDTGYGFEPVHRMAASLTELPCNVVLTHGHHDHALGAMWFERVYLHPADIAVYRRYTGEEQRRRVLEQARERSIAVDEERFLTAAMPEPIEITAGDTDLGGMTARVIPCPGHTPGSLVFYVPERRLLLTGDDWNPTTWVFFPEALPVNAYLRNMRRLLTDCPFEHALCSHSGALHSRAELEAFFDGLTPERMRAAEPCPEGDARGICTGRCVPAQGQQLVFDLDRYREEDTDDRF